MATISLAPTGAGGQILKTSVIHALSADRDRTYYPTPSRYALTLTEPLYDVREVRLRQASVPRTDLRVAEGTFYLYVDRVVKFGATAAFVVDPSIIVYTRTSADAIWQSYEFASIDSPLATTALDDAVLGAAMDGYVSAAEDASVFVLSHAGEVVAKAYAPPAGLSTALTDNSVLVDGVSSRAAALRAAASLVPGRALYAFVEDSGGASGAVRFGAAQAYTPTAVASFELLADRSLALGLGVETASNLGNAALKWRLVLLGTRSAGLVFQESVASYVSLEGSSTAISVEPPQTAAPILVNPDDVREALTIVQTFGSLTVAQLASTAITLNVELEQTTLDALEGLVGTGVPVTEGVLINYIAELESQIAAADLAAQLAAAAEAAGYYEPLGEYGNARFKLVEEDAFAGDQVHGTSQSEAVILDASRRALLLREGAWLKTVDSIAVWASDVVEVNARKLLRYIGGDSPASARYMVSAADTSSTTHNTIATVLVGDESEPLRDWQLQNTSLPNAAQWPPVTSVSAPDALSLTALLFTSGEAWLANIDAVVTIAGDALAELAGATSVPGNRLLVAATLGDVFVLCEASGRFARLAIDESTPACTFNYLAMTATGATLPFGTDAGNNVLVPPGSRCFFLSNSGRAWLFISNYIYRIDNLSTVANVVYTARSPSAVARQNDTTALFVDALGVTELHMDNHNIYERLSVDRGDALDTTTIPFVSWSNPSALVTNDGAFYTLRKDADPFNTLVYLERCAGQVPPIIASGVGGAGSLVHANWREGTTIALAADDGIYRVQLYTPAINTADARLALVDASSGSTSSTLANVAPEATILAAEDYGVLVLEDGNLTLYDASLPGSNIFIGAPDPAVTAHTLVYGPSAWLEANLTHAAFYENGTLQELRTTPAIIDNSVLSSVAYSRVPRELSPYTSTQEAFVAASSTGATSRIAVFARDANLAVQAADVNLDGVLSGGYMAVAVVGVQASISYRNITGGVSTRLVPLPYAQTRFQSEVRLDTAAATRVGLASWTRFNHNLLSEAAVVYDRGSDIYFRGNVTIETTGALDAGAEQVLAEDVGNIDFLRAEPVYVEDTANYVAAFATIYASANTAYVAVNRRDYTGWTVCTNTTAIASNVDLIDVTNPEGNTIYITATDSNTGVLKVIELSGSDNGGMFSGVNNYPSRDPTNDELPAEMRTATPNDIKPSCCAHIYDVENGVASFVYVDSDAGARIGVRTLETYATQPYSLSLAASEGEVANVAAELLTAIDVNFSASSGSVVDDTLGLNLSHSLVPFGIDMRSDEILAAVLGWRDRNNLLIASEGIANAVVDGGGSTTLPPGVLERIFTLADSNGDGVLEASELTNIVTLPLTQVASTVPSRIIAEVEGIFRSLQSLATFDNVALASMRALDPDGSGGVAVTEFAEFVQRFVDRGQAIRSPGNIDQNGTRVVDLYLQVDGRDAVTDHTDTSTARPFTVIFLDVERGERALYQAGQYPAIVRFNPPRQSITSLEFSFFNERLEALYEFFQLENQLIFEVLHGPRAVASEQIRQPDGTYERVTAPLQNPLLDRLSAARIMNLPSPGSDGSASPSVASSSLLASSDEDSDPEYEVDYRRGL